MSPDPASSGHDRRAGRTSGHGHGVNRDADRRYLLAALGLLVTYMAAEVVVGLLAGSLALLSDAAHMLTDAAAIVLALVALRLAAKPPRGGFTYGLRRAEILSAQANGLTLLLLAAWFTYEGMRRLVDPPSVDGAFVLVTALVGVGVNLVATWLLSRANRTSLNVEGAFQHILNDLYAFLATAAAGLVLVLTGFDRADAIASFVIVALMTKAGLRLVRDSGRVFLEAAPADIDPSKVGDAMVARPCVEEVHDLHIWEISSGAPAASAHVLVQPGGDCHAAGVDLEHLLRVDYGIAHTTLQVDHTPTADTPQARRHACVDTHGPTHHASPPGGSGESARGRGPG